MLNDEVLQWETINHPSQHNYNRSNEDDTSVCWNYQDKTVEVFTNRRHIYDKCREANTGFLKCTEDDVNRVYTLEYPFDEIRSPEKVLVLHRPSTVEV